MAKAHRNRPRGSQDDPEGRDPYDKEPYDKEPHEKEPVDDPDEHLEIERRRFRGGEAPTPELYARAREQWSRLPGALSKPPMGESGDADAAPEAPAQVKPEASAQVKKDGNGGER
jgi:hypothetical protein